MAIPLAQGHPIGARAPCWLGNPKGTEYPWQRFPKAAALPWRVESNGGQSLPGGKNPMKPAVSWHTILLARSSVLYLWRPWVAERGCSGQEQALSVSHRTGGFGAPRAKIQDLPGAKSACSGVGGAAEQREFQKKFLERSSITGGAKGISNPPQRRILRHFGNAIVFCFGRSSRSEFKISSMALFANL